MRPDGWIKITSNKTDWVYYSRSEILSLKRPIFLPVAKDFTNAEDKSLDPYHSTTSLQSATLAVEEWNSGVVPEINSLFPIELAANQISSNRMGAISPLVSRRKTEKELEKSLETPLIQPLNQSISNCKEILIEAIIQKNGQDPKFDHLDWEFVHSLLIDYIIRSNSFIQLDQFQGILFKIHNATPNDKSKSWDCLIHWKTIFKAFIPNNQEEYHPKESDLLSRQLQCLSLSIPMVEEHHQSLDNASNQLFEILTCMTRFKMQIQKLGIDIPKGILLHGLPGVGKSHLIRMAAKNFNIQLFIINPIDLSGSMPSALNTLRIRFKMAKEASQSNPVLLFIDEIDSIAPSRQFEPNSTPMVAQLLTLIDGVESRGDVILVGATNRPNYIDPALRRPGRFDREIQIQPPSMERRLGILQSLTKSIPLSQDVNLNSLAKYTNGYVMADLVGLVREASVASVTLDQIEITNEAFQIAFLKCGSPAVMRSCLENSAVEKMDWSMIGGYLPIKQRLQQAIEWPLLYPDSFKRLGISSPRGILLYGPPGCSKTTMVKIIASQSGLGFFSLSGASIYSSYLGESEQSIRTLFQTARASTPSIIFLDELDAIVGKRGIDGGKSSGDSVQERVLSTLLNEMDGIENANGVIVIGATNRPDMIDAALMRPGRFDHVIHVPTPTMEGRLEILEIFTKDMPISSDLNLHVLAKTTEGYTGSDLKGICREAALVCIREAVPIGEQPMYYENLKIQQKHFEKALSESIPTLSQEMREEYSSTKIVFNR